MPVEPLPQLVTTKSVSRYCPEWERSGEILPPPAQNHCPEPAIVIHSNMYSVFLHFGFCSLTFSTWMLLDESSDASWRVKCLERYHTKLSSVSDTSERIPTISRKPMWWGERKGSERAIKSREGHWWDKTDSTHSAQCSLPFREGQGYTWGRPSFCS